jgi:hypothetical protein
VRTYRNVENRKRMKREKERKKIKYKNKKEKWLPLKKILTFLSIIREVTSSNLGLETIYSEYFYFPLFLKANAWIVP